MADHPKNLKYTKEHEWARREGNLLVIGVTAHAQESLGDVVYVELPKAGAAVKAGESFGVIESTKAVSELFAPVSGKVVKVNGALVDSPSTINSDPYGAGWIIEVEPASAQDYDGLLDVGGYEEVLKAG